MKIISNLLVYIVAILITAYILPGISISGGIVTVIVLAVVLGVINTFIKPVLVILTLPASIMSLGLFVLVINALLVMLAGYIVPGFAVANFWWALLFAIVLAIINAFLSKLSK